VQSWHLCWWGSWEDCPERNGAGSCWLWWEWEWDFSGWSWFWVVWGGKEVFVLVHLCQEGRDVGGLVVGEVVVLVECGSRLGK
jgi:hypothetical protein